MKHINTRVLVIIILVLHLFGSVGFAADKITKKAGAKHKPLVLQTDTQTVNVHQFDQGKIQQYVKSRDFKYDKKDAPAQSFWSLFWDWIYQHLFRRVFESSDSNSFFYYLFLSLGVIFLVYLFLKISGINIMQIIRGRAQSIPVPYSEIAENIYEIDFDSEIDKAITAKNYRLAVRLLYLSSLKHLTEKGLINWQIEKTNHTYISEISDAGKQQKFNVLTMQFEYVWYGEFYIDVNSFQNIRSSFQQFKQDL